MAAWKLPLQTYRRRSLGHVDETSDVMFVLCSENHAGAAFATACEPAMVLQIPGGARDPSEWSTLAAFEHAVKTGGVRRVIVCGHVGCYAVGAKDGADRRAATAAYVAGQCRRLLEDENIAGMMNKHGVSLRGLLFDDAEGDVYACDVERGVATLMADDDLGALLLGASSAS